MISDLFHFCNDDLKEKESLKRIEVNCINSAWFTLQSVLFYFLLFLSLRLLFSLLLSFSSPSLLFLFSFSSPSILLLFSFSFSFSSLPVSFLPVSSLLVYFIPFLFIFTREDRWSLTSIKLIIRGFFFNTAKYNSW